MHEEDSQLHPHPMSEGPPTPPRVTSYWERSQWPLQSLYMLLPLLIFYELGMHFYVSSGDAAAPRIWAQTLLRDWIGLVGVSSLYLPGLLVVAVLVSMHLVRRDPWEPELKLVGLMWVESFLLSLPLLMFSIVIFRDPSLAPVTQAMAEQTGALLAGVVSSQDAAVPIDPGVSAGSTHLLFDDWKTGVLISVGAGIYEELLFRLIAIAALDSLFKRGFGMPATHAAIAAVVCSALVFSLYHFNQHDLHLLVARDREIWLFLAFAFLAGIYFGAIFIARGFGIVAATHALYDILVVAAGAMG